jgi:putative membrane protein
MACEKEKTANEMAIDRTDMAMERTVMAADRSLMAWVRTGLSLISFGFTIYKFLEYEREQLISSHVAVSSISSPKVLGLFMIGVGILSLILGTAENIMTIRVMRRRYDITRPRFTLFISGIIIVLGVVLFMGIIFKMKGIS